MVPDTGSADSTLEVSDPTEIGDINCKVDFWHWDANTVDLVLTSPAAKQVTLHQHGSHPGQSDIVTTYDSRTEPDGPGSMSDYDGEVATGNWTLSVQDHDQDPAFGRLRNWSLIFDTTDLCHDQTCSAFSFWLNAQILMFFRAP